MEEKQVKVEKTTAEVNAENKAKLFAPIEKEEQETVTRTKRAANLADAKELLSHATTVKRLELPTISPNSEDTYYVDYCPLRTKDMVEIRRIKDEDPDVEIVLQNRETVYQILSRADKETWTKETVYDLPLTWIEAIMLEYGMKESDRFLQPIMQRKLRGLKQIQRQML